MAERVIVSTCLTGIRCRYDGGDARNEALEGLLTGAEPLPLCPEELGGLPTPRPAAEIEAGDGNDVLDGRAAVLDENSRDVTANFIEGAKEGLRQAITEGAKRAIMKEKSPSCGVRQIKRKGKVIEGSGVFTALLKKEGFHVSGL